MAPARTSRKRKAPGKDAEGPSKPEKQEASAADMVKVPMVDLVDVEDAAQYEAMKAKAQADMIRKQNEDEANKPVKLAAFNCIICMDNPTDLTVTHCGMYQNFTMGFKHFTNMSKAISSVPNVYSKPSTLEIRNVVQFAEPL